MSPLASYIVQTAVTLLGVGVVAFVVVQGARKAGVGRATGPMDVVGRLPLDARRTVFLVRVGELVYVVGASDAGMVKLGEIAESALFPRPADSPPERPS